MIMPTDRSTTVQLRRLFLDYYSARLASGDESASGPGSTREVTSRFIPSLLSELSRLQIKSLLDAPCGDFNWVGPVANSVEEYIGLDIVPALIERNNTLHGSRRNRFIVGDLVNEIPPKAAAVLSRDFIVHLSYVDAFAAIRNILSSGAIFLITTTFVANRPNRDIKTGFWRPLNLERAPFTFPPPIRAINEHYSEHSGAYSDKSLAIWRCKDLSRFVA